MKAVVADTHAAVWYVLDPNALSIPASAALDDAEAAGDPIYLASISLVEIRYLVDKGRFAEIVFDRIVASISGSKPAIDLVPLDLAIARRIGQIPKKEVPDMPDRIIAATALYLGLPLVTRDKKIQAAAIRTIW